MSDIDPVQFGQLIQSVETMSKQIDILTQDVTDLKTTLSGGKGLLIGLVTAAGGVGAGMSKALDQFFK